MKHSDPHLLKSSKESRARPGRIWKATPQAGPDERILRTRTPSPAGIANDLPMRRFSIRRPCLLGLPSAKQRIGLPARHSFEMPPFLMLTSQNPANFRRFEKSIEMLKSGITNSPATRKELISGTVYLPDVTRFLRIISVQLVAVRWALCAGHVEGLAGQRIVRLAVGQLLFQQREGFSHRRRRQSLTPASDATPRFTAEVLSPLLIQSITLDAQVVTLNRSAIRGESYFVRWNTGLNPTTGSNLPGTVIAPTRFASSQNKLVDQVHRFHRATLVS